MKKNAQNILNIENLREWGLGEREEIIKWSEAYLLVSDFCPFPIVVV